MAAADGKRADLHLGQLEGVLKGQPYRSLQRRETSELTAIKAGAQGSLAAPTIVRRIGPYEARVAEAVAIAAAMPSTEDWFGPTQETHAILSLLQKSLMKGHYKVALRRALMLIAIGHPLPENFRTKLEGALEQCSNREVEKMWVSARLWSSTIGVSANARH